MGSWITTGQLLIRQDAKSSHMRSQASGEIAHGQHGYSLGPATHHYRCQNVYISTTAIERIVDTLEFFPNNYQMSQLSSTDRLLMAAKDMTDTFQNPHPNSPPPASGMTP
jgi:hypothetical protein